MALTQEGAAIHSSATLHPSSETVNILLTSFAGLGLPRTLSLPIDRLMPINEVVRTVYRRLPVVNQRLIITTTNNKQLLLSDEASVSTILSSADDTFLPLRLSARLCGGKGGFGSQLRAAGGRMNSRKSRQNQQQDGNGSNRNLDGRRLRTVDEAKRLAEYLSIKPEMERKEKEERKKRWEAVVEAAETKSRNTGSRQVRLDANYVEGKEAAEEKTRDAVLKAMREGRLDLERTGSESSMEVDGAASESDDGEGSSSSREEVETEKQQGGTTFFGWDDEDEDEDEDEGDEGDKDDHGTSAQSYQGKGKGAAV